jgi:SP family myo-inositol transporter-like MFS transporter 13
MYYSPSIVELAGFASHQTALLLSLIVSGLNALGTIVGKHGFAHGPRSSLIINTIPAYI